MHLQLPSSILLYCTCKKNKLFISTICLPTFFPPFWWAITTNCHRVMIIFPIKFKLIRFNIWINCQTLLFIITTDCHRVMIIFTIKFKLIKFDIWINCWTLLFGSTQIGFRFSTCKVQLWARALVYILNFAIIKGCVQRM